MSRRGAADSPSVGRQTPCEGTCPSGSYVRSLSAWRVRRQNSHLAGTQTPGEYGSIASAPGIGGSYDDDLNEAASRSLPAHSQGEAQVNDVGRFSRWHRSIGAPGRLSVPENSSVRPMGRGQYEDTSVALINGSTSQLADVVAFASGPGTTYIIGATPPVWDSVAPVR